MCCAINRLTLGPVPLVSNIVASPIELAWTRKQVSLEGKNYLSPLQSGAGCGRGCSDLRAWNARRAWQPHEAFPPGTLVDVILTCH